MSVHRISVEPSTVARVLGWITLVLVLASLAGQLSRHFAGHDFVYGLVPLFDLDGERNIPTLFSVCLLAGAAALLAVIALLKNNQGAADVSRWVMLAIGFLCMAADEGWSFHERLIQPMRGLMGGESFGIFYYAWVIPGIIILLLVAPIFVQFLLRLPAHVRNLFLSAAAVYIGGVIGVELIGGTYAEMHGTHNMTYSFIVTVEESLEVAGVILFIYALLNYIADNYSDVSFRFVNQETGEDESNHARGLVS